MCIRDSLGMLGMAGGVGSKLVGGAGPISASGGTKTFSGDYTIHTFNSPDTFQVDSGAGLIDYLVVGGGGGGGSLGGGGGAGLLRYKEGEPITPGTYPVTIGAGGGAVPAHPGPQNYGNPGGATTLALSCLLYTSPSPRDLSTSRMPSSA